MVEIGNCTIDENQCSLQALISTRLQMSSHVFTCLQFSCLATCHISSHVTEFHRCPKHVANVEVKSMCMEFTVIHTGCEYMIQVLSVLTSSAITDC